MSCACQRAFTLLLANRQSQSGPAGVYAGVGYELVKLQNQFQFEEFYTECHHGQVWL